MHPTSPEIDRAHRHPQISTAMTAVQAQVERASKAYSASFSDADLAPHPSKQYLVVTCMDARIDPAQAFGIALGEAHVIRNAGGSAVEALRSIIISQQLLGTKEIIVVKHTHCGMVTFKNEDAYAVVERNLGSEAAAELKTRNVDFLPFSTAESAVKEDVEFLKTTKLIPDGVAISGWVYDVKTGATTQIA